MRCIRTEMYFEEGDIQLGPMPDGLGTALLRTHAENPGLAVQWCKSETAHRTTVDVNELDWMIKDEVQPDQIDRAILRLMLGVADVGPLAFSGSLSLPAGTRIMNPGIIPFVLQQNIVVEESPPVWIPFKDLLKKTTSPVCIGSMVGMAIGAEHPILMLLTVPAGIVVVGSAVGVSAAMAAGLNKKIKKLFDGK